MLNIKYSLFCAAMAACLGTGYGARYVQGDGDQVRLSSPHSVKCEDTEADKQFKSTRPMNSKGQDF